MKAVIQTGGKQYIVTENDKIRIEKLDQEAGEKVTFEEVLLVSDDAGTEVSIGTPTVEKGKVEGTILRHGRNKKVIIGKHKAKKRYRLKQGHRQWFSEVEIKKIAA